jgi:hypothetical protein
MESEAVVDALAKNAAKACITLENKDVAKSRIVCRNSRTHTGRSAAYDNKIYVNIFGHIT